MTLELSLKRVIENLKKFKEPSAFLRGLVAYIGFRQTFVEYDRDEEIRWLQ